MSTRIEIKSEGTETVEDGIVLMTSSTVFHSMTLEMSHDEAVAELRNMGAELADGPKGSVVYIEHWEGEITVVVEDEDKADDVRFRLANA